MSPVTRGSQTSESQIEVFWSALTGTSTGGSSIDTYNLQWDAGSNGASWNDIHGQTGSESLALTYIQTSGITAGETYQF